MPWVGTCLTSVPTLANTRRGWGLVHRHVNRQNDSTFDTDGECCIGASPTRKSLTRDTTNARQTNYYVTSPPVSMLTIAPMNRHDPARHETGAYSRTVQE